MVLKEWLSGDLIVWVGIVFCVSQSAVFSGLNLAFFSLNRLELEVSAGGHNSAATKVLALRQDANFLLATILWGNVGINVLLASRLVPVIKFYQFLLYPVAGLCSRVLDLWLGKEGIAYLRERDLRQVIEKHVEADEAEIEPLEGIGAMNFLTIDDLSVSQEGETVAPLSVIKLPVQLDLPVLPVTDGSVEDPFLQ